MLPLISVGDLVDINQGKQLQATGFPFSEIYQTFQSFWHAYVFKLRAPFILLSEVVPSTVSCDIFSPSWSCQAFLEFLTCSSLKLKGIAHVTLFLNQAFWCLGCLAAASIFVQKHSKNCECCPGHYLIVSHYSSMSWFKFLNLSVTVNCVTKSLIH